MDEHARYVDRVRVQFPRLDQLFHLGDGDPAGHRHERVEVPGGLVEDQVPVPVALRSPHEGEVGGDAVFEDVVTAAEGADLLGGGRQCHRAVGGVPPGQSAVRDLSADARGGEEGGDTAASGTQPFGERALGHQLDLQLTVEVLAGELLVLADVRAGDTGDAARCEQDAESAAVRTAVVGDHAESGGAAGVHRLDQHVRHPAQAESANGERCVIKDVGDRLGSRPFDFVHGGLRHLFRLFVK